MLQNNSRKEGNSQNTLGPRLFITTSQYWAPIFSENVTAKAPHFQLQSLLLTTWMWGIGDNTIPPRSTGCYPTAFGDGDGISSSASSGKNSLFIPLLKIAKANPKEGCVQRLVGRFKYSNSLEQSIWYFSGKADWNVGGLHQKHQSVISPEMPDIRINSPCLK